MKRFIIRLLSLLGLTVVTGCGNDPQLADMYGCPSTYEIEANGSEFAARRVAVDFSKAEYEGGGDWYRGKATAKVDVTLDKVEK